MVEVMDTRRRPRAGAPPRIFLIGNYTSDISIYSLDGFDNKLDDFSTKLDDFWRNDYREIFLS